MSEKYEMSGRYQDQLDKKEKGPLRDLILKTLKLLHVQPFQHIELFEHFEFNCLNGKRRDNCALCPNPTLSLLISIVILGQLTKCLHNQILSGKPHVKGHRDDKRDKEDERNPEVIRLEVIGHFRNPFAKCDEVDEYDRCG